VGDNDRMVILKRKKERKKKKIVLYVLKILKRK